jgi:hypothetical protein
MKHLISLALLLVCLSWGSLTGQVIVLHATLQPALKVSAGSDTAVLEGVSATLGAAPTAWDGYGGYVYLWSPSTGLDDPTSPNPVATPSETTVYTVTVTDLQNCWVQDEVIVRVSSSAIGDADSRVQLAIYPNPASGTLNVKLAGAPGPFTVRLLNTLGAVVLETAGEASSDYHEILDIRSCPKGTYSIVIITRKQVLTRTLLIL